MFLTEEDYRVVCDPFEFETVQANTPIRMQAEKSACEEICSYTRNRYDMVRAFSAEGEERNPMLVQCAVSLALWYLTHRLPQSMGYERRERLREESVRWLRDVQASKATPDLPTYTAEDGTPDIQNPVRYGSQKPTRPTW